MSGCVRAAAKPSLVVCGFPWTEEEVGISSYCVQHPLWGSLRFFLSPLLSILLILSFALSSSLVISLVTPSSSESPNARQGKEREEGKKQGNPSGKWEFSLSRRASSSIYYLLNKCRRNINPIRRDNIYTCLRVDVDCRPSSSNETGKNRYMCSWTKRKDNLFSNLSDAPCDSFLLFLSCLFHVTK